VHYTTFSQCADVLRHLCAHPLFADTFAQMKAAKKKSGGNAKKSCAGDESDGGEAKAKDADTNVRVEEACAVCGAATTAKSTATADTSCGSSAQWVAAVRQRLHAIHTTACVARASTAV